MKTLRLFLLVSVVTGPSIIGGSIVGAQVSRPGLFIGAIAGGLLGVVVAVWGAVRLTFIGAHERPLTTIGAILGFVVAALFAAYGDWQSPLGPALCGLLVPMGAVIGARTQ